MSTSPNQPGTVPPPPPRSGCGCFGIGCGCAVVLALLCGGLGLFGVMTVKNAMIQDPAKAATLGQSIATLDIPAGMNPQGGMDINVPFVGNVMQGVMYGDETNGSMIILAEFQFVSPDQAMGQVHASSNSSGQSKMVVTKTTTEKFKIRNVETTFEIAEAHPDGKPAEMFWQVIGTFPGHKGTAGIMMSLPQATYTIDDVRRIINSIR